MSRAVAAIYLVAISLDVLRKVTGLGPAVIGVIYIVTLLAYAVTFPRLTRRYRELPATLPVWLVLLTAWCLAEAVTERIPAPLWLLGWASYVFYVPLAYLGALLTDDDKRASLALRWATAAGALIGLGCVASTLLGSAAPAVLQPLVPGVGIHSSGTGNVFLSPSIFATAEESSEYLLVALFAWLALAYLPGRRHARLGSGVLGSLIIAGLVATERRAPIYVAAVGVAAVLLGGHRARRPGARPAPLARRRGAVLAVAAASAAVLIVLLGVSRTLPFLFSGSPGQRLSFMLAVARSDILAGQGPGTSTQGTGVVGAVPFSGYDSLGQYTGYTLDGRSFMTAEGGFSKTLLELGVVGVVLYGAVLMVVLVPLLTSLRRLDPCGRSLTAAAAGLGVLFMKGHQSLDNPLVQPLFWLCAGGAWGRLRAERLAGSRGQADQAGQADNPAGQADNPAGAPGTAAAR